MTLALIAVMFAIFWLGLTIRDEMRELRESFETGPMLDNDELREISTTLTEISSTLQWIADNPRERE